MKDDLDDNSDEEDWDDEDRPGDNMMAAAYGVDWYMPQSHKDEWKRIRGVKKNV